MSEVRMHHMHGSRVQLTHATHMTHALYTHTAYAHMTNISHIHITVHTSHTQQYPKLILESSVLLEEDGVT